MDQLIATLPLLISLLVPPLFALARGWFGGIVPDRLVPVVLPIGGGVVAGIAHLLGVDASILANYSSDPNAWETVITGIMSGLAAIGVHQIKRQGDKAPLAGSQRGFARPGALVLLLVAAGLTLAGVAGCTGTRDAYRAAASSPERIEATAYVVTEHYYAVVREAAALKNSGALAGDALEAVRAAEDALRPLVLGDEATQDPGIVQLVAAYKAVRSAETEAELQAAVNAAVVKLSALINALKRR